MVVSMCATSASAQAGISGIPQRIEEVFKASTSGWVTTMGGYARRVFLALAGIELTLSFARAYYQRGGTFDAIAAVLIERMLFLGFWSTVLLYAGAWIPDLIQSLRGLGSAAARTTLSPTDVFEYGIGTVGDLGLLAFDENVFEGLVLAIPLTILAITFVFAAAELLGAIIDSYIVASAGIVLLGFGGSTWTAPIAENYLRYALGSGIHLMVVQLVAGLGMSFLQELTVEIAGSSGEGIFGLVLYVMGYALLFAYLLRRIPSTVSSIVTGAVSADSGAVVVATTSAGAQMAMTGAHLANMPLQRAAGAVGQVANVVRNARDTTAGNPARGLATLSMPPAAAARSRTSASDKPADGAPPKKDGKARKS